VGDGMLRMTKIEKLLQDPERIIATMLKDYKSPQELQRMLIVAYCPSEFGLKNCRHCTYSTPCEDCWNEEVEE
jgi:hypothetical protein